MIPYFKDLGERIERAWFLHSYNEELLPQLALDELNISPPFQCVKAEDIIDWTFNRNQEFLQPNPRALFGEPPVTLFQAPRFYIEALFWLSGTTAIHQHGFSGVFAVLAGSSVHSQWCFVSERTVNSRMLCGRLERLSTEILRPGSMRPIHSGSRYIHQLFHLEVPSVTIIVRTYADRHHLPQYAYLPPGLAIDPDDHDPLRTRRIAFIDGMARGSIAGLRCFAHKLIDGGDLETLYYMFSTLSRRRVERELCEDLYEIARERHGDVIELIRKVCETERRTRIVTSLRARISDPGARFFLALLMLMPDRESILEAVRLHFPEVEPLALIETWLASMSGKETTGLDFNDEENRLIFRSLVEGLDAEGLLQRLGAEFQAASVEAHRNRVLDHAKKLAKSDLFFTLLSDSPLRREVVST